MASTGTRKLEKRVADESAALKRLKLKYKR